MTHRMCARTAPAYFAAIRIAFCVTVMLAAMGCALPPAGEAIPPTSPRSEANPPPAISPNEFEGSDAERINRAIEAAAASGRRVVIPRDNISGAARSGVWLLDSAILLQSNTTLELDNCRIKASDRCRDNLMRSANCGRGITEIHPLRNIHIRGIGAAVLEGADHPRATGDSAKTLGAQTYGTDAGVAGESQKGDWRNIGILLAFVEDFSIQNLAIKDSHCWAVSLERCSKGTRRNRTKKQYCRLVLRTVTTLASEATESSFPADEPIATDAGEGEALRRTLRNHEGNGSVTPPEVYCGRWERTSDPEATST